MSGGLDPPDPQDTLVAMVQAGLLTGIFVAGRVLARTRRFVGDPAEAKEVVDYRLLCADKTVTVSQWEPGGQYYPVGLDVMLPVSISAYHTAGGGAAFRLQTGVTERGQAF